MGKFTASPPNSREPQPYTPEAIKNVTIFFEQQKKMREPMNWFWEYQVCFSCDDSWKLGDEYLTEEEAKKRSVEFVDKSAYYGVVVDVRWNKMELCERCKRIGQ